MADITAAMVKELRDRTGAGMSDCKNALVESGGDGDKAVEILQKKGAIKTAKKAGAIAAEGAVHAYIHHSGRVGVLVEVNCQTDFVARGADFKSFVETVGMQIAAATPAAPLFVRREEVPESEKERLTRVFREQLEEEEATTGKKKPEQAKAKILEGKLDKWLSDVCLEEQKSISDEDHTIKQLSDALTSRIGEKISVRRFVRFELGEGIEKKKEDLAQAVAETIKSV